MTKSYFTIQELTYSSTAKKNGITNIPNETERAHLQELIDFLNPIREKWGTAIIVTSGFRCEELNAKVGGVKTSAHRVGYAADLKPANNKTLKLFEMMKEYLKDKDFDELIFETNSSGGVWVHFALKSASGKQRRKIKMLEVK
jgi:putative chitinase